MFPILAGNLCVAQPLNLVEGWIVHTFCFLYFTSQHRRRIPVKGIPTMDEAGRCFEVMVLAQADDVFYVL